MTTRERNNKRRFLTAYIDPKTGRERLGSGGDGQCFHYYANVKNVIRYGLRHDAFPPGQYNIYSWPRHSEPQLIGQAYKLARPDKG